MIVDIITIFPEMFTDPMSTSMIGLARERSLLELNVHDLRDHTTDRHRSTDDYPYGGGPGMVMKPEPIFCAVRHVHDTSETPPHTVFLTPGGTRFTQAVAHELAALPRIVFVCGRYEGFDERTLALADREISIGDYVLTGGELPAMVITDAVTRLLPGVLGHEGSAVDESFSESLLEYPQYTRPAEYEKMMVPDILLSGDHARIAEYRREQSIIKTARVRPDLLPRADLTETEQALAQRVLEGSDDSA